MLLTHSFNTCYLLTNLYFFRDIKQQKFVYIIVAVIIVVNVFQLSCDWFVILM